MNRTYLEEDLQLIRKYFPGARSVALRTPFDLTVRSSGLPRLQADSFRDDDDAAGTWQGDAVWTN